MPRKKMSDTIERQLRQLKAKDNELSTIKSALSNLYRALDVQYYLDPVDENGNDVRSNGARGGTPRQYVERLIGINSFQQQKEQIYMAHAITKAEEALWIRDVQVNKSRVRNSRWDKLHHPYDDTYEADTGKRIIAEDEQHSHRQVVEVSLKPIRFQKVNFQTGIMVNINREYRNKIGDTTHRKDVAMVPEHWIPLEHRNSNTSIHDVVVAHYDNESHNACTDFEHHCWCDGLGGNGCNTDLIEKTKAHFEGGE